MMMDRRKALLTAKELAGRQRYRYRYLDLPSTSGSLVALEDVNELLLTYEMPCFGEIQIQFNFMDSFYDLLAFPNPVIVTRETLLETIRLVNCLNGFVKLGGGGRFYVDEEHLDIALSQRVSYEIFEVFPEKCIDESISCVLDFYSDVAVPLSRVASGEMSAGEGCAYIQEMWG